MENENQVIDMKKEIQIRKMKKSDLPQLQEMYRDLIPEGVSMEVLENNYYRTVDRPEYFLAVAADGDKVFGSTMGIVCIALDAPFLVVENVIVSGECRGQGVGRKIFEALDEFAFKNQCEYALLVSSGFRKGAHRFYEAVGYTDDVRGFRKYY